MTMPSIATHPLTSTPTDSDGGGPLSRRRFPAFLRLAPILLLAFTASSCGYSSRPPYNPAYKTVAVPIFNNKSFRREWEFRLTEAITKNIEYRTPYKVVSQDKADTILSGQITSIDENVLTERTGTILPRESQLTVVVDFTWKDRSGRVLVERKGFNRSATEIPPINERVEDAEQLAIERLAAAIVDQMRVDW